MVHLASVRERNQLFADERHEGLVCVFAGATSGIGLATLEKMAAMLHDSTFYILGRVSFQKELKDLKKIGPSNQYNYIHVQLSLIADTDSACIQILETEKKVDYMCLSPGYTPWGGAVYTAEGLEECMAISYYSRLRIVFNLLSLLQQADRPRVISILNGTHEMRVNEQDIGLQDKKNWGIFKCINHAGVLTSLAFRYLAAQDEYEHITFIHSGPGVVFTGLSPTARPKHAYEWSWWAVVLTTKGLVRCLVRALGMPANESGERHAYELTSDDFKPGSWGANSQCDVVPANKALSKYLQNNYSTKTWDYTVGLWMKALAVGS